MDIRAQYLLAMREQSPALFKRLGQSGDLEKQAALISKPKDQSGQPTLQNQAGEFLNFPSRETSLEEDERNALLVGDRPLTPSNRTTSAQDRRHDLLRLYSGSI